MGVRLGRMAPRVAAASLTLSALAGAVSMAGGQAVVRGFVYDDSTLARVRGAGVVIVDPLTDAPVAHATADSLGQFAIQVARGRYQIVVIRDGYNQTMSAALPLEDGEQLTLRIPVAMHGDPQHRIGVLEHVRASGASSGAQADNDMSRFESRRKSASGLFYDRSQFGTGSTTIGDFLRSVPGLSIGSSSSGASSVDMRHTSSSALAAGGTVGGPAACKVGWFLDGHRMDRGALSGNAAESMVTIPLSQVEALEIYRGMSEVPAEFADPDVRCGAVVIWTRR